MAMIQKIRKRQGLLLVIIGLGMLGFLIPYDAVMSFFGRNAGEDQDVAKIGESMSISRLEFDQEVRKRRDLGFNNSNISTEVWNDMVEGRLLGEAYDALGIDIQEEEAQEMMNGTVYSPFMNRAFGYNPLTPLDSSRSQSFKLMFGELITAENAMYEGYVDLLSFKRKQEIFDNVLSRGLHVNSLEAKYENLIQNSPSNFQYVVKKYADIPDSEVSVSDSDVESYFETHKSEYWQDVETRDVFYVEIPIIPSQEDESLALSEIEQRTDDWRTSKGALAAMDARFENIPVWQHSSIALQGGNLSYKSISANEVSVMESSLFEQPIGTVVGPYRVGDEFISSRVLTGFQPSSVTSRSVLVSLQDTTFADSLVGLWQSGTPFEELLSFTLDESAAATGGVIELAERDSSSAFHDYCFTRPINFIDKVETPEGWRVTQVIDQQGYESANIAFIRSSILPSAVTKKAAYDQARSLTNVTDKSKNGLKEAAQQLNFLYKDAKNLTQGSIIPAKVGTENVVSAVFDMNRSVGDILLPIQTPKAFFVVQLSDIQVPGMPTLQNIEEEMRTGAMNLKKGDLYAERMSGPSSIDELASTVGETVKNANQISWKSPASIEPQVACAALSTNIGMASTPVVGKTGVWVILPRTADRAKELDDYTLLQSTSSLELRQFMGGNRRVTPQTPFKHAFWTLEMMKKAPVADLRRVQQQDDQEE